jgi:CarD family transcriptional regulator
VKAAAARRGAKSSRSAAPAKAATKTSSTKTSSAKSSSTKTSSTKTSSAKPSSKTANSAASLKAASSKAASAKAASSKTSAKATAKTAAKAPQKAVATKSPNNKRSEMQKTSVKTAAKPSAVKAPAKPAADAAKPAVSKPAAAVATKPVAASKPAAVAPRVEEAKKPLTQRQGFKTNEFVVYPAHGVGQILAIEEQEIAGARLELFVINFIKDKMTLRVPTAKVANVGMRKLSEPALVKKALETLKGRARVKRTMWSRRAQEYEAKINSGDIVAIAEVVRDLYRSESQPEQSYSERQLYEAALDRLSREIAVVQQITETEAVKEVEAQLVKSPRRGSKAEAEADGDADGETDADADDLAADEAA